MVHGSTTMSWVPTITGVVLIQCFGRSTTKARLTRMYPRVGVFPLKFECVVMRFTPYSTTDPPVSERWVDGTEDGRVVWIVGERDGIFQENAIALYFIRRVS